MTRTEYQQHLLDEYASYLRKAIANKTESYTLSPQELAAALLKAFEKGAMKGVLFESQNDVEKLKAAQKVAEQPKQEKREISEEDAKRAEEFARFFSNLLFNGLK